MTYEHLLVAVDGAVAIVTINRPKVLNALNAATLAELGDAMRELQADASVRAVILTGAGEKAFVAGADINELAALAPDAAKAHAELGQRVFDPIEHLGKPVIAAVNGFALGGGCELAMACTVRLAADAAKFGQPEVKLGLTPGFAGTQRLPRLVGKGRAMELMLGGAMIDAAEAHRIGLVNRVVPAASLAAEARALADAWPRTRRWRCATRWKRSRTASRRRSPKAVSSKRRCSAWPSPPRTCARARGRSSRSARRSSGAASIMHFQGSTDASGLRIAIVVSRFNDFVTDRLQAGAPDALRAAGAAADAVDTISVPGAYEVPQAARTMAASGRYDAVVCLGCLIRGETPHFEYISEAVAHGIMAAAAETGVPMSFGVLTTNSAEQALERAVPGSANKGWEAAMAAVEMATLRRSLRAGTVA